MTTSQPSDAAAARQYIAEAWSDPKQVLAHLAEQLEDWQRQLTAIAQDLQVVLGSLDAAGIPVDPKQSRRALESIGGQLLELERQVASRGNAYRQIAGELARG